MFTCPCGLKTVNEEYFKSHQTEHKRTGELSCVVRSIPVMKSLRTSGRSDGESSSCSSSPDTPPSNAPLSVNQGGPESPEIILGASGPERSSSMISIRQESGGDPLNVTKATLILVNPNIESQKEMNTRGADYPA